VADRQAFLKAASMGQHIADRADFGFVRYANCWEDADVLCAALEPAEGRRVLSIASAGDNALALLAGGADVVAADISRAQLACLELRCAAFRHLSYEQMLGLLGVRDCPDRGAIYSDLRNDLSNEARDFWDDNPQAVARGIIHTGKFERYFRIFRKWVLPLVHGRRTVARLIEEKDADSRRAFYDETWDNRRWRWMFRLFFSRWAMGRLGRDPELFRYVEGSVADRILARARYALAELPTHTNPYLEYILTGRFTAALPRYLRPEHFETIRAGLPRLTLYCGRIEDAAKAHGDGGFDGFNLSDIFEYLDPRSSRDLYANLLDHAQPGARLAYWNMLVPRRRPDDLADRVDPLDDLATELFARDRAFFYQSFILEQVR
jgi:S-adenosylmethionine-diacylglycerol 3-amino-3-carboxypropyl transferase